MARVMESAPACVLLQSVSTSVNTKQNETRRHRFFLNKSQETISRWLKEIATKKHLIGSPGGKAGKARLNKI